MLQRLVTNRVAQMFIRCSKNISTTIRRRQTEFDDDDDKFEGMDSTAVVKNLFFGHFNTEIFDFPEVEIAEDLEDFNIMSSAVEKFMKEVNSSVIDKQARIPPDTMEDMKRLGLFGIQIPIEYGGLGFNAVKRVRISEYTNLDGGISATLTGHEAMGAKGILIAGTEKQKKKYLPVLAKGDEIAAFCLTEPHSGSDIQSIQTRAILSRDGTCYFLNGTKSWVTNGGIADIMIVFAKTEIASDEEDVTEKVSAFIVERNFGGVNSGEPENLMGNRGCNICTVSFDNTRVPIENLLGEAGHGFNLAMEVLESSRFTMGGGGTGIVKFLLQSTLDHVLSINGEFQRTNGEFQLIMEKIARIATDVYVMESMTYLTAGLIDRLDKEDFSLEAAVVKIFSSRTAWNAINECLQIVGSLGYTTNYPHERFLRDARAWFSHGETNEILLMLIGGTCLQYVGKVLKLNLEKIAKPEKHLMFNLKRSVEMWNSPSKSVDQQLQFQVHEDLAPLMDELSRHANHFRYLAPQMLAKYGRDIIEEQMLIRRFVENVIDMYAICSVTSRATRSLCLRLQSAFHERDMTYAFAKEALHRIHVRNNCIGDAQGVDSIPEDNRIADTLMKFGGYCADHPLTRNW